MRINCEYCGTSIDITKDESCPGCGAAYDKNKYLEQLRKHQEELNELNMEAAKVELAERKAALKREQQIYENMDKVKKVTKPFKTGCLVQVILIAVIVLFSVGIGVYNIIREEYEDYKESCNQSEESASVQEEQIIETATEVGFNESADLIQYSVICDKMEEYYYPWMKPQSGFYYVKLHLIVTNRTDEKLWVPGEMLCQYEKDGYKMQAKVNTISSDDLGTRIYGNGMSPDSSTEGWVYFEVPIDTDLILKYDEYVTINIDADNCIMLEQ